jgi:hypothetical protein
MQTMAFEGLAELMDWTSSVLVFIRKFMADLMFDGKSQSVRENERSSLIFHRLSIFWTPVV